MEALIKRKGIIKGQFTKFTTFINTRGKDATVEELNARLSKTIELYKQFIEVEDQIFTIDTNVVSEMDVLDEMYFLLIGKIQKLIRVSTIETAEPDETNNTVAGLSMNQTFRSDFKLPRLSLPTFDGNVKQWNSFYDIFTSTVHENISLSPAQKFKYLLGQLRGAAYTSICHFRVDDANYYEALKRLTKKYDKKKSIVETYIRDFLAIQKLNKASSSNIMKLHDTVDETLRGLKSLGPKAIERDPWIILLASDKLDDETRRVWKYESAEEDFPTTQQFLDFLNKRMDALTETIPEPILARPNYNYNSRQTYNVRQTTAKMFHSAAQFPTCPICQTDHRLYDCSKFRAMSVVERRELMTKANRCYNCLSDQHAVTNCKSPKHCRKCFKRHNTLLHIIPDGLTPIANHISMPSDDVDKINSSEAITNSAVVQHQPKMYPSVSLTNQPSPIIQASIPVLPTALIEVQDRFGNWVSCRALLDSGSTHSFVSEEFISKLKSSIYKCETKINTLNSSVAG